jgi:signal transduction histidine kinase
MKPRDSGMSALRGYGLAALCAAAALAATASIQNPLFPTPLYFAAVVIATWYGGPVPGIVTTVLAAVALDYYFLLPTGAIAVYKPHRWHLLDFVLPALLTAWFVRKRRLAETSLREVRDELQLRIEERQAELARVSRLMTIGEMGVSIAHEVNQPLMAIVLNADACLRWLDGERPNLEEARSAASRIVQEGSRAGEVVQRIRNLARNAASERVLLDVNEVVGEALTSIEREATRNRIGVRTHLGPHITPVRGDRVQLQQVVLNLVMNAFEAMRDSSEIREAVVRTEQENAEAVIITVEDTGPGLPEGDRDQVFVPFFTTKPGGIGIGLSISRSIVESHGGRLWAVNLARGASFQVRLPAAGAAEQ